MKIFFTTPINGKQKYQKYINEVIRAIESCGASVVSPEKDDQYRKAFSDRNIKEFGNRNRVHYEFIRQGIASSDAVIFEASHEDFRVGHEVTLALMYGKSVLVLSQLQDYSKYITHERLVGKKYHDVKDIKRHVTHFVKLAGEQVNREHLQAVDEIVDIEHSATLSTLRYKALQGKSYFSDWARRATKEPDLVYTEILERLGNLPIQKAWDVFAKIYNEDTPDNVFIGAAKFADKIFRKNGVSHADQITDCACGTGAISRILTSFGYRNIIAFDRSRNMLAEAFRLMSHMPSIKIIESEIEKVQLTPKPKGIVWFDFSSNFALSENELSNELSNLVSNLTSGGILICDVRTRTGWNVDFFKQKVTAYETDNFQRLWVNLPDYEKSRITFDIFIRIKDKNGAWLPWEREQMTERMWGLSEVRDIVKKLANIQLEGVYSDDFTQIHNDSPEPGLAYFVVRKS